jgi:hypothetical protein
MKFKKFNETDQEIPLDDQIPEKSIQKEIMLNNLNTFNNIQIPLSPNNTQTLSSKAKLQENLISEKNESFQAVLGNLLDEIGFSKYHYLVFTVTALILISAGVQELMLAFVLSVMNYGKERGDLSRLTQYDLAIVTTSEYLGYTSSAVLINFITYYISNRRSIQIFSVLTLVFTGISIFSLEFYTATITRYFTGICLGVIDTLLYLNLVETCPTRIRGFIGSFILLFFPLGQLIIALICYGELKYGIVGGGNHTEFRYILLVPFIIVVSVVFIILPFMEDSARRIAISDYKASLAVVKKISKFNKNATSKEKDVIIEKLVRKATEDFIAKKKVLKSNTVVMSTKRFDADFDENFSQRSEEIKHNSNRSDQSLTFSESVVNIFNSKYCKNSVILFTCAFFTGFIFNGIFFLLPTTAPNLNYETFKYVIISVSMEIPANCVISLLIETNFVGRLKGIKLGYFLSFITCLICFYLNYLKIDFTVINCLLKFFITIPQNVVLIYASEIYEGKLRTFGVTAINFWKRVGTIISPFVVAFMLHQYGDMGPYFLFTPLALISFFISLILNMETRNKPLE